MANYERKDRFYRKAKEQGLPSRAAFKLEEMLRRFPLLKAGDKALDLGAAPGGWTLLLAQAVGPRGKILAVDLEGLSRRMPAQVEFLQADLKGEEAQAWLADRLQGGAVQAVFSDMSPKLTGITFRDAYLSYELGCLALAFAKKYLTKGGALILKIFPGEELPGFLKELRESFKAVKTFEPEATRKTSKEVYLVAQGFTGRHEAT